MDMVVPAAEPSMAQQHDSRNNPISQDDVRPRPDPTVLTTQQLLRELSALRELIEARLDGMDKATAQLAGVFNLFRGDVDTKVTHLQSLHDEKFRSIQVQFEERDTRTEQTTQASTTAINAALQAAKEAVNQQNVAFAQATSKAEAAIAKQIDALQLLIQTGTKGTDDKIGDMKERITLIEGKTVGQSTTQAVAQTNSSFTVAVAAAILAAVLGIAGLIVSISKLP